MTFCRRFPSHLLPQVEDALAHLLHNVGEGEWEVLILPAMLPNPHPTVAGIPILALGTQPLNRLSLVSRTVGGATIRWERADAVVGEADETPTIRKEDFDE